MVDPVGDDRECKGNVRCVLCKNLLTFVVPVHCSMFCLKRKVVFWICFVLQWWLLVSSSCIAIAWHFMSSCINWWGLWHWGLHSGSHCFDNLQWGWVPHNLCPIQSTMGMILYILTWLYNFLANVGCPCYGWKCCSSYQWDLGFLISQKNPQHWRDFSKQLSLLTTDKAV